jgi:hypothetical protein
MSSDYKGRFSQRVHDIVMHLHDGPLFKHALTHGFARAEKICDIPLANQVSGDLVTYEFNR